MQNSKLSPSTVSEQGNMLYVYGSGKILVSVSISDSDEGSQDSLSSDSGENKWKEAHLFWSLQEE